jgi:hypothetical protein
MDDIGDVDESLLIEHCILFSSVKLMDDIGDVDESISRKYIIRQRFKLIGCTVINKCSEMCEFSSF